MTARDAGKQVRKYTLLNESRCEYCGDESGYGFLCKHCDETVCIDCDCRCYTEAEGPS